MLADYFPAMLVCSPVAKILVAPIAHLHLVE
jgi:hypothetical protein